MKTTKRRFAVAIANASAVASQTIASVWQRLVTVAVAIAKTRRTTTGPVAACTV